MVIASEDPKWWKPSWNPNEKVMKIWAFSDFYNQVESDIENLNSYFQIEDDGRIGGNRTCVQLIARNKEF